METPRSYSVMKGDSQSHFQVLLFLNIKCQGDRKTLRITARMYKIKKTYIEKQLPSLPEKNSCSKEVKCGRKNVACATNYISV